MACVPRAFFRIKRIDEAWGGRASEGIACKARAFSWLVRCGHVNWTVYQIHMTVTCTTIATWRRSISGRSVSRSWNLFIFQSIFIYETTKLKLAFSRDCSKRTVVRYLRHFHFRGVTKGDFQLLCVDSFFVPEGIFGNEDECDDVPKNITISYK